MIAENARGLASSKEKKNKRSYSMEFKKQVVYAAASNFDVESKRVREMNKNFLKN